MECYGIMFVVFRGRVLGSGSFVYGSFNFLLIRKFLLVFFLK